MSIEQPIHCPPAIAVGCEPSIGLRLSHKEAVAQWVTIHGPVRGHKPQMKNKVGAPLGPRVPTSPTHYTFVGEANHRRPGSLGAAFIDWLIANPSATEAMIKGSGHDLKHLRWDLENNPALFKSEDPKR